VSAWINNFVFSGELLLDQQRFPDAIERFERAIELEKLKWVVSIHFFKHLDWPDVNRTPSNVLPLVNKGLALYQSEQNIAAAERCCNEALRIDPECDAAVATLAQLCLQQGRIDKAIDYLQQQVDLARTEPELVSALTYLYVRGHQISLLRVWNRDLFFS